MAALTDRELPQVEKKACSAPNGVCYQLFRLGQVTAGRPAVIQPGRGEHVRAERVLADRGAGARIRAATLAVSWRG